MMISILPKLLLNYITAALLPVNQFKKITGLPVPLKNLKHKRRSTLEIVIM